MNAFFQRKLGEVLAFCMVGQETINLAGKPFAEVIGSAKIKRYQNLLAKLAAQIGGQATEITLEKSEKTAAKLRGMRDTYIGDEWDNPTEVLEWFSFFEGAAFGHWSLVLGSAEVRGNQKLFALAKQAVSLHRRSLTNVGRELREVGSEKAKFQ